MDLLPTTMAKDMGTRIYTTGCSNKQIKKRVHEQNTHAMFDKIHPGFREYYKYTNAMEITERLKESIQEKTAHAVVDGSFDPVKQLGTAYWIITDGEEYKNSGSAQATGSIDEMKAYQAELFGIYTLLLYVMLYCEYFEVSEGRIEIACDCLSAIEKSLWNKDRPKVSEKHHDVLIAIYELRMKIPVELKFRHVYGHQDKRKKNIPLDKWELLNCECNMGAKCHMMLVDKPLPYEEQIIFGNSWRISVSKNYINRDIAGPIYDEVHGNVLIDHIAKRNKVSIRALERVDWDAMGRAAKKNNTKENILGS